MPKRQLTLNVSASITLDNFGNGIITLGPTLPGIVWMVANEACQTTSQSNQSTFYLFTNAVAAGNLLAGSFSGNLDSASIAVTLFTGNVLVGQWTGGDHGATATMSLYGTQTVP